MDGLRLIRRVDFLKATRRTTDGYRRSVSGATALEFGLIMPVFLLLVFAVVETSVYYYKQSHLKFILSQAGRVAGQALLPNGLNILGTDLSGAALGGLAGSVLGRSIDRALAPDINDPPAAIAFVSGPA